MRLRFYGLGRSLRPALPLVPSPVMVTARNNQAATGAGPGTDPIAVVIAAHNAADTLDAALASVAGQSLAPQEVVVVDDASSDETAAVAARWGAVLPLDVVRLPENTGPGHARNVGVARTAAPMLALLDGDDVWLPDHLSLLDQVHRSSP